MAQVKTRGIIAFLSAGVGIVLRRPWLLAILLLSEVLRNAFIATGMAAAVMIYYWERSSLRARQTSLSLEGEN